MKILPSLLLLPLALALGCGDAKPPAPAPKAAKQAVPEPTVTAEGTHVLAFNFDEGDPCAGCVGAVNDALAKLPGIKKNDAEKGKKVFTVEYDPKQLEAARLVEALKNSGEGVSLKVD
jgi:copper chaperone CopZ